MPMFEERFAVAVQNCGTGTFYVQRQMACFRRKYGARGKPYKIERVGKHSGFVEIVYAPNQAAFDVPPCPEIFNVKISHSKQVRCLFDIRTNFRPDLYPAIKRRPQE